MVSVSWHILRELVALECILINNKNYYNNRLIGKKIRRLRRCKVRGGEGRMREGKDEDAVVVGAAATAGRKGSGT